MDLFDGVKREMLDYHKKLLLKVSRMRSLQDCLMISMCPQEGRLTSHDTYGKPIQKITTDRVESAWKMKKISLEDKQTNKSTDLVNDSFNTSRLITKLF